MAQRINEDIRFYLPADPYYYQVDNLPLEDLLSNDVRLQAQIDEINSAERGNTVGRAGFTELQPFIDAALPGTVSVRPGSFIGRVQRTNSANLIGNIGSRYRIYDGLVEMNEPPTTFGSFASEGNPTGTYNVHNPPNVPVQVGEGVGRNAVIIFKGGNISIDSFNFEDFQSLGNAGDRTAPLGRLDLIGITTMNGAMDDPYLPGNPRADGVLTGDGYAKLAVVKGAGIVDADNGRRVVTIGEKFITVGSPQENINDYGRDINGDVVPNPEFGTVPAPDDVVNVNFARNLLANGEIVQSLNDLGYSNKNGNFFLPVAYVFVPQSHVEGNPIPEQYLKDIRPFFRTAELTYPERQAIIGALKPSLRNPFVTEYHAKELVDNAIENQPPPPPPPDPGHRWEFRSTYAVVSNENSSNTAKFGRNGTPVYLTIPGTVFNGKIPVAVQFRARMTQLGNSDARAVGLRMHGSSGSREVARAGVDIDGGRPLSTDGCINTFLYPPNLLTDGRVQIGLEVTGTPSSVIKISLYVDGFIY